MSGALRLAFTLEAIDKATATVAKVNARIDKLTEPARRVRAAFTSLIRESRLDRIGDAADRVGSRLGVLKGQVMSVVQGVAAIAAVGVGAALGFKRIADEVDHINDTAQLLGVSTQQLQRMGYAAQLNGSSFDQLAESLKFLSANMVDARNGNQQMVDWFKRLGVSTQQLAKMTPVEMFEKMSDTFNRVGDAGQNSAKKIAVMKALMGRSGAELKQLMDIGAPALRKFYEEADRMGVVLDTGTVDAMASFNDMWDRMRLSVFGVMATALGAAAPVLESIMKRVTEWTAANKELIATKFAQWVDQVADRLPDILRGVSDTAVGLGRFFQAAERVANTLGGWPNLLAAIAGVISLSVLVSIGQLVAAVWSLNVALLTNPFGMTLLAVSALVALLPLLILHWDKVIAKAQQFNNAIPDWMKKISPVAWALDKTVTALAPAAPTGNPLPTTTPGQQFGKTEVGGTLKITIDQDGKARVAELAKTPWSPMNLSVDTGYLGGAMAAGR
jgi:hypothetical protein